MLCGCCTKKKVRHIQPKTSKVTTVRSRATRGQGPASTRATKAGRQGTAQRRKSPRKATGSPAPRRQPRHKSVAASPQLRSQTPDEPPVKLYSSSQTTTVELLSPETAEANPFGSSPSLPTAEADCKGSTSQLSEQLHAAAASISDAATLNLKHASWDVGDVMSQGDQAQWLTSEHAPEYGLYAADLETVEVLLSAGIPTQHGVRLSRTAAITGNVGERSNPSVILWVNVRDAINGGLRFTDVDGAICYEGAKDVIPSRFIVFVLELRDGLCLQPAHIELSQKLFSGTWKRVALTLLSDGVGDGLMLVARLYGHTSQQERRTVMRIHNAITIAKEVSMLQKAFDKLGTQSPRLLHGPVGLGSIETADANGQTDVEPTAYAIELVGACWTIAQHASMTQITTYKQHLQRSFAQDHEPTDDALSLPSELWRIGLPLSSAAIGTATRAKAAASGAGGFIELQLQQMAEALIIAFVPHNSEAMEPETLPRYEVPAILRAKLDDLQTAGHVDLDRIPYRDAFVDSFVFQCGHEVWADCAPLIALMDLFESLLGGETVGTTAWLQEWRNVLCYQHGNLKADHIWMDSLGSVWLVGSENCDGANPFLDAAELISTILFELYPIPIGLDEVKSATPERLQRLLCLPADAALRMLALIARGDTREKLLHKLPDDEHEIRTALNLVADESTARIAHSQGCKLYESLLEPIDGKAPTLWQIAHRKVPTWATNRHVQYAHQLVTSVIKASMQIVIQCSKQCHGGHQVEAADIHVAHLLLPLLQRALHAIRSPKLSIWQKRFAWDSALRTARFMQTALYQAPHLPQAVEFGSVCEAAELHLPHQHVVVVLRDTATRLVGGEGPMELAVATNNLYSDVQVHPRVRVHVSKPSIHPASMQAHSQDADPNRHGDGEHLPSIGQDERDGVRSFSPHISSKLRHWRSKAKSRIPVEESGILHGSPSDGNDRNVKTQHAHAASKFQQSHAKANQRMKVVENITPDVFRVTFDALSHVALPWPVPDASLIEPLLSMDGGWLEQMPAGIASDVDRLSLTASCSRYSPGQQLVVFNDGAWEEAIVLQAPDGLSSTIHTVNAGGAEILMGIHPWNHAPLQIDIASFNAARMRYLHALSVRHAHITDSISGEHLDVFGQCILLEMAAVAGENGPGNMQDASHLYAWLKAAHHERCTLTSVLTRLQRMVSQGSPDEAAATLEHEIIELAEALPESQRCGQSSLTAAAADISLVRSEYASTWENLLAEQRTALEDFRETQKKLEEEMMSHQQAAQIEIHDSSLEELKVLDTEHRTEVQALDYEHSGQRAERLKVELSAKQKHAEAAQREYTVFKEGQYREVERIKKMIFTQRVELEKDLATQSKGEQEALKGTWQDESSLLNDSREQELMQTELRHAHEKETYSASIKDELEKLQISQAAERRKFALTQEEEVSRFDTSHTAKLKSLSDRHAMLDKKLSSDQEDERRQLNTDNKTAKQQLVQAQTNDRKSFMARQKDDVKKHQENATRRKQELADRHNAERQEEINRRKNNEPKARGKGKQQKEAEQTLKEEKPAESKKLSPQKEREQLEVLLHEERENLSAKHEAEMNKFVADQARQLQQLTAGHAKAVQDLLAQQASSKQRHQITKDAEKEKLELDLANERASFVQHLEHETEKHELVLQSVIAQLHQDEKATLDKLAAQHEEDTAQVNKKHKMAADQMRKQQQAAWRQMEDEQEKKRKKIVADYEEELAIFGASQEEARKQVVAKHKGAEKQLDDKIKHDRGVHEERLNQEMKALNAKHEVPRLAAVARHASIQAELDAAQATERRQLAARLQREKLQFVSDQTGDRERHGAAYRIRLKHIIERAQNKFNRALISNSCVLLTAGPSAGKTVLVSQIVMHAINDPESQLIPIPIKLQELHTSLIIDRKEVTAEQSRWQQALEDCRARHNAERDDVSLRQDPEGLVMRHTAELEELEHEYKTRLDEVHKKSAFANSWNWVDAYLKCVYGSSSSIYAMLRQALISRRALLLLDGLDEGGVARHEIERHVVEVLAPQGHTILVTARSDGLEQARFQESFEWLTLRPMSDAQQKQLIDMRLSQGEDAAALLDYVRSRVPLDAETGQRETGSPLMLSMVIAVFEHRGEAAMPSTICELYGLEAAVMLERVIQKTLGMNITSGYVPHLVPLLEAIFFRAHAAKERRIEGHHIEAAALELGSPGELSAIEWPRYKGRVRVGHVVRLVRGEYAGKQAVLKTDARGKLINGREPRRPFKVIFTDNSVSGWIKEHDLISSGLDRASFEARLGSEGRQRMIRAAFERLPAGLHAAVKALHSWVICGQLPLLSLLQAEPFVMQASHLSFQEFYCAKGIVRGMTLPGDPPWRWSAWWINTLRLGSELGDAFGSGMIRATGIGTKLDLVGQIGGHRPTSMAAVSELMLGATSIDLSENSISATEVAVLVRTIRQSRTLVELSLARNPIGDEGVLLLSEVLPESSLVSLNLFGTGIKQRGAKAISSAILKSSTLTHLNLQYNAVRGESKRLLETANAARPSPLFLVL